MEKFSYLRSSNAEYIEDLFHRYQENPDSVDATWRYLFEGIELGATAEALPNGHPNGAAATAAAPAAAKAAPTAQELWAEAAVADLILAYRELGSALADIDPLGAPHSTHPDLELSRFGLTQADLNRPFAAGKLVGLPGAKLSEILTLLKDTYCGKIGVEFMYMADRAERDWLLKKMESSRNRMTLDAGTRKLILKRLSESEAFERFLHTRYVAQKRFSIEGAENTIPLLDCIVETTADLGAQEITLGMAHRGRLNVLTNILGKKPEYIFTEFEGTYHVDTSIGEGDVKYHMGYSTDTKTRGGKSVHLSLTSNPSHLEVVNPVVEGIARAKQTLLGDTDRTKVLPILIHGDAAFAGQGVVYETLNLSQLEGYGTGGTIHLIINNQVGFTTSPKDSRSTAYCTDLAKMLDAPIFHVNGDDAEAVWYIARLAAEYRQKFRKDVFIDLVCYRKHGHNEGDEPSFTQPLMYKTIKSHPSPREVYARALAQNGTVPAPEAQAILDEINAKLAKAQALAKAESPHPEVSSFQGRWQGLHRPTSDEHFKPVKTAVAEKTLKELAEKLNTLRPGFQLHPKLSRFFEARLKAVQEGKGIDWGNAEALAYASLLVEGYRVRISGQDAERGTFTHRHAVLNDIETGETYTPFNHLAEKQAKLQIHNSHLSEVGVMGFEYGYSLADPSALVVWEAQFGDFANGAQVIIDQFLATGESKWSRMNGLTLLLPHGYEGQAAEHSSARLERFLQLSGKYNMIVGNFTTPAQIFHALRRQMKREFRKPLIVMSPKSLLRHPMAISTLSELSKGSFQEVIDDAEFSKNAAGGAQDMRDPKTAKRVLLCSGKVYYDLLAARTEKKLTDVAIVRVEQLYPWPEKRLAEVLGAYSAAKQLIWVQEEPRNMGAWTFVFNQWMGGYSDFAKQVGGRAISYAGREICASPAVGSGKVHEVEQKALVTQAFS